MLKALIVDDEIASLRTLELLIGKYEQHVDIIGVAHSANEGIEKVKQFDPDIVFLDIEMPGGSGFDFLEGCPHRNFDVIFITAYNNYAIKAFKYSAIDYLLKPIEVDELHQALEKIIKQRYSQFDGRNKYYALFENIKEIIPKKLVVSTDDKYECIDVSAIQLVEQTNSDTVIKLADNSQLKVANSFAELSSLLEERHFAPISNSQMINLAMVRKITNKPTNNVQLRNKQEITVKPEYLGKLNEVLSKISK
ncbi:MAG: two-component system, LytTR family, response regulator [Tenuifilum sp.]|jgi:two-component system LytT family response regulator|uniref:LytR/AlgR family response regulator transcription factor n=1 Tax=Tenuifilum sp. TaxID=2760880 RepID=UPI0024AAC3CE|nr:LytTR family DNA-binding domain-containing protein [Tenuifilum sp.]MDI3526037.1 two-component system, LytTR family, response regulator [Tenuifilum sp.]